MVIIIPNNYSLDKFSKDKLKRKIHSSKNRNNIIFSLINLCLILFLCFNISKDYYIKLSSKDLAYAVNYNLTHNSSDKKLMRVKCMKLIEKKNTSAILYVSGLSSSKPHKTIYVTATFEKKDDIWYLDRIY